MLFVRLKEMEVCGRSSFQQPVQNVNVSGEIQRQHKELDSLRQQNNNESEALCLLRAQYDSVQQEMEKLLEAIDKRHQLLDSLDSQLDSEITSRRQDIEVQLLVTNFVNNFYLFDCLSVCLSQKT